MSTTWHGLSLGQTSSPPLLFQYTWSRQGYALCVTDLTSIWTEKLSHKEILIRAEGISTTIDPSEDQEQFDVLLVKIGEALRGDGGSATLNSGSQDGSLELSTSSRLPAPLRPLKWTLFLSKETSSSLTDHLLLPLLKDEAGWESRQRVLLDQLKQKDWALGKLLDKFESLGVELGTVFPGAAGLRTTKKGSTRSDAGKFVKGLAPFDEPAWLRESGSSSERSGLAANILHELGGSRGDAEKIRAPQDKWWNDLPKRSETASSQSDKNVITPKEDSPSQRDELVKASQQDRNLDLDLDQDGNSTASDDDDFQRQETPPRIKAQREKLAASSPSKSKGHPDQSSNRNPDIHAGEATASDSEPEADAAPQKRTPTPKKSSPPKPEIQESPKRPTKPRGRLGAIGGKKKKEEKHPFPTPPSPSPPPIPSPVSTPRKPKGGKLGMIGGKAKNKAPEAATAAPERKQERSNESPDLDSPAEVVAAPVPKEAKPQIPASREEESADPVPEETEEQKTARKREELKRQLEEKSKAPKKKRRF
ncbi:XLF/Cernunnos protein [Penicillium sp. IBT 35674x]|nr:XLF/Cernunnos protein [Penicillium sp. IBT 35674x]